VSAAKQSRAMQTLDCFVAESVIGRIRATRRCGPVGSSQ
jgi:hypothetical protein